MVNCAEATLAQKLLEKLTTQQLEEAVLDLKLGEQIAGVTIKGLAAKVGAFKQVSEATPPKEPAPPPAQSVPVFLEPSECQDLFGELSSEQSQKFLSGYRAAVNAKCKAVELSAPY